MKNNNLLILILCISTICISNVSSAKQKNSKKSLPYIWPLPYNYSYGNQTISLDPSLSLTLDVKNGRSVIVEAGFLRYKDLIFKQSSSNALGLSRKDHTYDISKLRITVHSDHDELQFGADESYSLIVTKSDKGSIVGEAAIEANSVFGALRGLETFSQLCVYDYTTKSVQVHNTPWFIRDKPRFAFRGLMLDTSRHYLPVDVIKQVIESMSYAKLNVLHWHIIDKESFPIEIPTYPNLWKGAYTKWERYTLEDAYEIVNFAKMRGINVMAEVDVPGHAESWGAGYPDLWPSHSCKQPLDVSKEFTFNVISGMLTDLRKIFPFELFHLGGDEVNTDCWTSTPHVKKWLQDHNMTGKGAYEYFVLRAQQIALSKSWTPVNWEETFNTFPEKLNPQTVVHNWLGGGVCPLAVAKGFRCIFSNQGFWYLDHLDVPWDSVYTADPLEGISKESEAKLVIGGEVCMWGETADASNVQQTIWPRAAAAAERLWSNRQAISSGDVNVTALSRLKHFRCLLTKRGVPAAPVTNFYAREPPTGPGSCYDL